MATYIVSPGGAAGAATSPPVLTLTVPTEAGDLVIPSLQDVTINNANDVFTWTQLDNDSKLQVATTATNSISTNIVVDSVTFFGTGAGSAADDKGVFGLSKDKTEVTFTINIGDKVISGSGFVTGLAPTVSADSPVWVTPVTLTINGALTVA